MTLTSADSEEECGYEWPATDLGRPGDVHVCSELANTKHVHKCAYCRREEGEVD